MPANVSDDSPGPRLVRTAFDAKAPVPLEVIFNCAPLVRILDPYLPIAGDMDDRHLRVETILRDFLDEREDSESKHPQKRRVGKNEEFSPAEYAISLVRLLFYGPVGKGEEDYRTLQQRRKAAVTFVGQVETDSRRLARLGTSTTWSPFVRELTAYLVRQYGDAQFKWTNERIPSIQRPTTMTVVVNKESNEDLDVTELQPDETGVKVAPDSVLVGSSVRSIGLTIRRWCSTRKGKALSICSAALIVVSVVVVFSQPHLALLNANSVTTTSVYFPSSATIADAKSTLVNDGTTVTCARTSLASMRKDARLCTGMNLVFDPCFLVDSEHVVCPVLTGDGKGVSETTVYKISSFADFYFDAKRTEVSIGVEKATTQLFPWGLVLNLTDGKIPYTCVPSWDETRFELGSYVCNSNLAGEVRFADPGKLAKDGSGVIRMTLAGARMGSPLYWSKGQATVELQDEKTATLQTVRVVSAWY
jgi:hypothetical protein